MRWIFFVTLIALCVGAGYWLGSSSNNTTPHIRQETAISSHAKVATEQNNVEDNRRRKRETTQESASSITELPPPQSGTSFSQLLQNGLFDKAVNILYATNNPNDYSILKKTYIDYVVELLNTPDYNTNDAYLALDSYLATFYDDTEMLILQSQHQVLLEEYYEALITLQQANSLYLIPI